MDFLLECIGFPPEVEPDELIERALREGDAVPYRGGPGDHRRLDLGSGLELRLDREARGGFWTLLPHFQSPHRLRVAVESLEAVPDSPFDALLVGWASPPAPGAPLFLADALADAATRPGSYRFSTWLTDARRLPGRVPPSHVLAVSVAGFALDVTYVGPNDGVLDPAILERPSGAHVQPLGGDDRPGGCSELSLRIQEVRHLRNLLSGRRVEMLVADAPERPLMLFLSPWQLEAAGLPAPRPGWRVEGTFLFTGRIAGGLPELRPKRPKTFG